MRKNLMLRLLEKDAQMSENWFRIADWIIYFSKKQVFFMILVDRIKFSRLFNFDFVGGIVSWKSFNQLF